LQRKQDGRPSNEELIPATSPKATHASFRLGCQAFE
jgi:hypothetical protein